MTGIGIMSGRLKEPAMVREMISKVLEGDTITSGTTWSTVGVKGNNNGGAEGGEKKQHYIPLSIQNQLKDKNNTKTEENDIDRMTEDDVYGEFNDLMTKLYMKMSEGKIGEEFIRSMVCQTVQGFSLKNESVVLERMRQVLKNKKKLDEIMNAADHTNGQTKVDGTGGIDKMTDKQLIMEFEDFQKKHWKRQNPDEEVPEDVLYVALQTSLIKDLEGTLKNIRQTLKSTKIKQINVKIGSINIDGEFVDPNSPYDPSKDGDYESWKDKIKRCNIIMHNIMSDIVKPLNDQNNNSNVSGHTWGNGNGQKVTSSEDMPSWINERKNTFENQQKNNNTNLQTDELNNQQNMKGVKSGVIHTDIVTFHGVATYKEEKEEVFRWDLTYEKEKQLLKLKAANLARFKKVSNIDDNSKGTYGKSNSGVIQETTNNKEKEKDEKTMEVTEVPQIIRENKYNSMQGSPDDQMDDTIKKEESKEEKLQQKQEQKNGCMWQYLKEKLLKIIYSVFRFFKSLKDKFSKSAKKNNKTTNIANNLHRQQSYLSEESEISAYVNDVPEQENSQSAISRK